MGLGFSCFFLAVLCVMSVLFIKSAQAYDGGNEWQKQSVWCCFGFLVYFGVSLVDYRNLMKYAHFIYMVFQFYHYFWFLVVLKFMEPVGG